VDAVASSVEAGDFAGAAGLLASLRKPLDAFFEATTVNDPDPALRGNRLRLLAAVRRSIDLVADFSQVEG
jgi:glycyl-tRNA synthetase beta chain